MRKLVLKMSLSVDGFVCGPKGEIDWIFRTRSEDSTAWIIETLRQAGAHAMGSRTYYDMAAFWPYSETPFAPPMNELPKIVFSRSGITDGTQTGSPTRALGDARADARKDDSENPLQVAPTAAVLRSWAEPTVVSGDLAQEVARLKQEPGDYILAHGGATFAQGLVASGLVDEYRLVVHPVVLGRGLPLFSELSFPLDLQLVSTQSFAAGTMANVYRAR